MDINDQELEAMSPLLAKSLQHYKRLQGLPSITYKENRSKKMILSLPHRDIWECPCDNQNLNSDLPHHYGILEGVLQVEPGTLKYMEKVFIEVIARYLYEKGEPDQFDLNVRKLEYHDFRQLDPPPVRHSKKIIIYSKLTKKVMEKYGPHCFPFQFDLRGAPDSVRYYEHDNSYSRNGVTWFARAYMAYDLEEHLPPEAISIKFRKLSYMRKKTDFGFSSEGIIERRFSTPHRDGGRVELKATIDKQVYYHSDTIPVTIIINNLSDRVIKHLIVTVEQIQKLKSWTDKQEQQKVSEIIITAEDSAFPLIPGKTWSDVVKIKMGTQLQKNFSNLLVEYPPEKVDGWRDCCLAPSTVLDQQHPQRVTFNSFIQPDTTNIRYNEPCLSISYQVVVQCILSEGDMLYTPDVKATIAFLLAHKEPEIIRAGLKDANLVD